MSGESNDFLSIYGWADFYAQPTMADEAANLVPARVICEERNIYQLQFDLEKSIWGSISGKIQFSAKIRADYPAVGDWVWIELRANSDRAVIHQICPRRSIIYRKQIGSSSDAQILSTNVDYVFITTSVNEDLNHRRLERYLSMALDSKAVPVILLTKIDMRQDQMAQILSKVQSDFPGVAIHTLSKNELHQAQFFSLYLKQGKTAVFVGSSGVGKSTIVNFLTGKDSIKTQEVRESDGKGRHTTTARNMYLSHLGGLIIDTPGMRELSLSDHELGVEAEFDDLVSVFENCKFSDCKHVSEPGCAVKAGLSDQSISRERWESYLKLQSENRHKKTKQDKNLAVEDRKKWKKITVDARERSLSKKKPK